MYAVIHVGNNVFVDFAVYARLYTRLKDEESQLGAELDVPLDSVLSSWVGESERGLMQAMTARTYQLEIGDDSCR